MTNKIISGDSVSTEDVNAFIHNHRLKLCQMERDRIRLNTRLSPEEKACKLRTLFYQLRSIKTKTRV